MIKLVGVACLLLAISALGRDAEDVIKTGQFEFMDASGASTKYNYRAVPIPGLIQIADFTDQIVCGIDEVSLSFKDSTKLAAFVARLGDEVILTGDEDRGVQCGMVADMTVPLLRKYLKIVTKTETSITLTTREANWQECFSDFTIDFEANDMTRIKSHLLGGVNKEFAGGVSWNYDSRSGGASVNPYTPFKSFPALTCQNCYAYLRAGIRVHIGYGVRLGIPPAYVEGSVELFTTGQMNLLFVMKYMNSARVPFGIEIFQWSPVPFRLLSIVGVGINLELAFKLRLEGALSGYVQAEAKAGVSAGVDFSRKITLSTRSGIKTDHRSVFNKNLVGPTVTGDAGASLEIALKAEIAANLFNFVKANVWVAPYIGAQVDYGKNSGCSLKQVKFQVYTGVRAGASAGAHVHILVVHKDWKWAQQWDLIPRVNLFAKCLGYHASMPPGLPLPNDDFPTLKPGGQLVLDTCTVQPQPVQDMICRDMDIDGDTTTQVQTLQFRFVPDVDASYTITSDDGTSDGAVLQLLTDDELQTHKMCGEDGTATLLMPPGVTVRGNVGKTDGCGKITVTANKVSDVLEVFVNADGTKGNDANPGTSSRPFRSLEYALNYLVTAWTASTTRAVITLQPQWGSKAIYSPRSASGYSIPEGLKRRRITITSLNPMAVDEMQDAIDKWECKDVPADQCYTEEQFKAMVYGSALDTQLQCDPTFATCRGFSFSGDSMVTILGLGFMGFKADKGAAISVLGQSSSLMFDRCWFEGNTATEQGAALFVSDGSTRIILQDSTVESCKANGLGGGAASVTGGASLMVLDSFFDNCEATQYGGSILVGDQTTTGELDLTDCRFMNGRASQGGAIAFFNQNDEQSRHTNCFFSFCNAPNGGGAVFINNAAVEFSGTTFNNNTADGTLGSAVRVTGEKGKLTISETSNIFNCSGPSVRVDAKAQFLLQDSSILTGVSKELAVAGGIHCENAAMVLNNARVAQSLTTEGTWSQNIQCTGCQGCTQCGSCGRCGVCGASGCDYKPMDGQCSSIFGAISQCDRVTEFCTHDGMTPEQPADNSLPVTAIVLGVVGAVCVIATVAVCIFMKRRKRVTNVNSNYIPLAEASAT